MKPIFICIAIALVLAGCHDQSLVIQEPPQSLRLVVSRISFSIYVVTIDGQEYVVAHSPDGISICPKTQSTP